MTMADESQFGTLTAPEDFIDERREIQSRHFSDVPRPHPRIRPLERLMARMEPTPVVAKPYVVASFCKVESETMLVGASVRS